MVSSWPPAWLTEDWEGKTEGQLFGDFVDAFGMITKDSVAGKSGQPLVLRDWQRKLMDNVLAIEGNGYKHRLSLIGQPRKNGKSALGSTIALYSLILGPKGGEVYSCAADRDQARIVFADAKRMIEANPELMQVAKLYRDAIEIPTTGSIYRVLSAEAFSKEGLSPTMTLFDELHAQPNRELFDVMSLGMGARGRMAMMVAITTAGVKTDNTGKDSIAYSLYQYGQKVARGEVVDPTFFMAWWEANHDADYRLEETWIAANPGYGDLNDAEDFASMVLRTPEAEFRTKRCNQWVSSQSTWLPAGAWDELADETVDIDPEEEYVLGFDGSFANDSTAIVAVSIPKDEEDIPRVKLIKTWEKRFGVDDDSWRVDIDDVFETIVQFTQSHPRVREIACDPYRWQMVMQRLQDIGLPVVEYYTTNLRLMIPATAKVFDAVTEKKLIHDGNAALSRHLDNCVLKVDAKGPRVTKESSHSKRKIDNAIAFIVAYDRATARLEEEEVLVPGFYY